jgi:hypothetical protein
VVPLLIGIAVIVGVVAFFWATRWWLFGIAFVVFATGAIADLRDRRSAAG